MSQLFSLASEFIERMSNPAYGIRENEDYSIRFGFLLATEGFEKNLISEIEKVRSIDTLSAHGWNWLLNWARSNDVDIDGQLLMDLNEHFSSLFMKVAIIDIATRNSEWKQLEYIPKIQEFPNKWLATLLQRCIKNQENSQLKYFDIQEAENIIVALMQVGNEISLDAASALINYNWKGQSRLLEFFWSICNEMEDETRQAWITRLNPPE